MPYFWTDQHGSRIQVYGTMSDADNVTVVVADVIDLDYGQSHPILGGAASTEDEEDAIAPVVGVQTGLSPRINGGGELHTTEDVPEIRATPPRRQDRPQP